MTTMTLPELAKKMAGIDFTMLQTHTTSGEIAGRPMSNNGDVEYDGDSWFFAYEDANFVGELEANPACALSFTGSKSLLGKPPLFVAVEGRGEIIREKSQFERHWQDSMKRWFEDGTDTPGMVLIKVHAVRITWWEGEDEGEIRP